MMPITINNQVVHLPFSWFEVTVSQYRRLLKAEGLIQQLEALSGVKKVIVEGEEKELPLVPAIEWENLSEIDFEQRIASTIQFLSEPIDLSGLPVPKEIKIGEKDYTLPKNIALKAFGQKLSLQNELAKLELDNTPQAYTDAVVFAVAVYLCDDPYSDSKARELAKEIDGCLITDIFPAGNFFFRSWINSCLESRSFLASNLNPNRSEQESERSEKPSKNLEPLTASQEGTY